MLKRYSIIVVLTMLFVPLGIQAQSTTTAAELPYSTSFEDGEDVAWSFNNTGNGWYLGSAANNTPDGSYAIYISNTGGTTHSFDPTVASSSFAYRPINFETAGDYLIAFDWISNGTQSMYGMTFENTYLYALLAPPGTNMAASELVPGDSWIQCGDSYLSSVTTWQHANYLIHVPTAGVYNLVFWVYCLGYGGNPPAPAVDNISVSTLGCAQPTGLAIDSVATGYNLHWSSGGSELYWKVRADGGEWIDVYDSSYLFTDLAAGMLHTFEVVAVCAGNDASLAASITFRTPCGAVSNYPWRENFDGFSWNAMLPCWTHLGDGLYRFSDDELEIRTGNNTNASIMVTPEIVGLSQLELTFAAHPEGSSSGSLTVGYITGPDASYVFTPIVTYSVSEWSNPDVPAVKIVAFSDAPDTARIAFKYNPSVVNWHWYIDDVDLHLSPICARPSNLTLVEADDNNLELAWSDENAGGTTFTVYYRNVDSTAWEEITTMDTSVTISGLDPSTSYAVRIVATCSDGSESPEITGTFMTTCPTISDFPYEESFDGNSALCWQAFSMNNTSTDNWNYNTNSFYNRNLSSGAYMSTYNDVESCNEWLVSPAVVLSDDMGSATLSWYTYAASYMGSNPRVEVKVSTSSATDTANFATTIYAETLDESTFTKHIASLAQFAGQTVYIAFVRRGIDDDGVILEDVSIYNAQSPEVSIVGSASPAVGLATTYRASLDDGSHDGLNYAWSSAAATAGNATMTMVDSATITLLYPAATADVLTLVATNTYGADTATLSITPMAVSYAALPYSTGFEPADDVAWTIANDLTNAWYVDTAAHLTGSRALYVSNDNGQHNSYTNTATSYSYTYKAFNFADAGQYNLEFDWRCYGEGSYDNLNVYLVPLGNAVTSGNGASSDWSSLTGDLKAANSWQHFSSIFNLMVPGVYNLVIAWKNDDMIGTNPPAAVDNLSLSVISCVAPDAVVIDAVSNTSVIFHWNGNATAYEVTVGDMAPVVVTDTFYTLTTLQPATNYTVDVRAICGSGDTSLYTSNAFTTNCNSFSVPFSYDFPSTTLDICWTNSYGSPAPYTSWSAGITTNHRIISVAAYNANPANDWLITPVIDIPATDTASLELVYFVYGYRNNNYANSAANYEVLVSPTGSMNYSAFTDTLVVENNLDTTAFMRRSFAMSGYAGQSICIAFHNNSVYNGRIVLSEVGVRRTRTPLFSVQGPNAVWVNAVNSFVAVYREGDLTGMTYSWTSTMAAAGNATLYGANIDTLTIVYNAMGIDTLTFVAHNSYGNDTVVSYVTVMNLDPVTTFPYATGFESSNDDNQSWILVNGTNAWALGAAASNGGSQAYYISNDNGASNAYGFTVTSRSYLYRAFDLPSSGTYTVRFDWNANGESSYDFLRAWFVPDSLFNPQADAMPVPTITTNSVLSSANIPGWISLGGKLNQSAGWSTRFDTIDIAGAGRYYLVFLWVNDGSVGHNPPAAIDNILVNDGTIVVCDDPVIDSVLATEESIYIFFTDVADNYEVAIVQGEWTDPDNPVSIVNNSYTFTSLSPGTQYTIGVRTVCDTDIFSQWTTLSVATQVHPCAVPTNLSVNDITLGAAVLSWTPGEPGQDAWQVHVTAAGFDQTFDVATNPTYTLTGLNNGTDYTYEVRAVCSETNRSGWSTPFSFSTALCPPVADVTVTGLSPTFAVVNWSAPDGASTFEVEYGNSGFSEGNGIRETVTDATSLSINGLHPETSYDVFVRTICDGGVRSLWSSRVTFTTPEGTGIDGIVSTAVSLHPNPASSTVTLTGVDGSARVSVIDLNGCVVLSRDIEQSGNQEVGLDVSHLASGAYFVRIVGERLYAIRKLIVE